MESEVKGNIRIGGENIFGWVVDLLQPDISPTLIFLINNDNTFEIKANLFRRDILDREFHKNGNCGYKLSLREIENITGVKTIFHVRVFLKEGMREIPNSPLHLHPLDIDEEKFFFMHIPKTAGTSFREMLYQSFPQYRLFPSLFDINHRFKGSYPSTYQLFKMPLASQRYQPFLLYGHYPSQAGTIFFKKQPKTITFLREPIARAVSNLKHIQRHFPQWKNKSLEAIAKEHCKPGGELYNRQTSFFTYKAQTHKSDYDLKTAFNNLEKVHCIGLTEEYERSIALCETMFGWNLGTPIHANIAPNNQETLSDAVLQQLHEANQSDLILYEYAKALFVKQLVFNNLLKVT